MSDLLWQSTRIWSNHPIYTGKLRIRQRTNERFGSSHDSCESLYQSSIDHLSKFSEDVGEFLLV